VWVGRCVAKEIKTAFQEEVFMCSVVQVLPLEVGVIPFKWIRI